MREAMLLMGREREFTAFSERRRDGLRVLLKVGGDVEGLAHDARREAPLRFSSL